ncbi:hypothetical protein INT43_001261 [Umbelopsis isabellina]|uniref:Uncharacterized protein n=1 Tax=Mortierella isabellina TaxID=91625 RepID=A0A8H7UDM4_MORIS|nr:hypothetical protein INT43_001261 [Umbelopsis isabellina]
MQTQQSNVYNQIPKKPKIKTDNGQSYNLSQSLVREAGLPILHIEPGQSNHQRREIRHCVSSQPIYSSMLSVLETELQRSPSMTSRCTHSLSPCPSDGESFSSSLTDIRNSTLGMFDTVQAALVRAEQAEKKAEANLTKWRTAVVELDRLRDENLLVRNRFENIEAECMRLRTLLDDVQSSCSTSATDDTPPSVASSSTLKKMLLSKLNRRARTISSGIISAFQISHKS